MIYVTISKIPRNSPVHASAATRKRQDKAHQSVCCGHALPSASQWRCPLCPVQGWWDLYVIFGWSDDQWRILPWCVSDSKATACHAWDLWRVLYLSARQCSWSPSAKDNEPSTMGDICVYFTRHSAPTAELWIRLSTVYQRNTWSFI